MWQLFSRFSHWLGFVSGRDFSRAEKSPQEFWALAPALYSSPNSFPLPNRYSNRDISLLNYPPCFYRVMGYIFSMLQVALLIFDSLIGKARLPHFSAIPTFSFHSIEKSTLDQLHGFLNSRRLIHFYQQVYVVWHNDKVMQLKFSCRHIAIKSKALRSPCNKHLAPQVSAVVKKNALRTENSLPRSIPFRSRHSRG
jgi:hypothetical protein